MITPAMPQSHPHLRQQQRDQLQQDGAAGDGQQSFEWVLRELTANQADQSAVSFAATGTLGFERASISAPEPPDNVDGPEAQDHTAKLPTLAVAASPEDTPDWNGLRQSPALLPEPRLQGSGDTSQGERPFAESSSSSPESRPAGTHAHHTIPPMGAGGGAEPSAAVSSAEPSNEVSHASAAHFTDQAHSANASRISVAFRPTDGAAAAYVTLPGWSTEDANEIRVRARYLLSLYGWADATLHVRVPPSPNPLTPHQERVYGR